MSKELRTFLADTLWFGMTSRLPVPNLKDYAEKRIQQGFDAVQIVIGIPPEVGPLNINASGNKGPAWDLQGRINYAYLDECEEKLKVLTAAGLKVIIYGGWGHQIHWIGVDNFIYWWDEIINRFEKYNPVFCLCGESSLWVGQSKKLLPDKTTQDLQTTTLLKKIFHLIPSFIRSWKLTKKVGHAVNNTFQSKSSETLEDRKAAWTKVAEHVISKTKLPLLIHTVPEESSLEAINKPQLLAAITIQTSHDQLSRNRLWKDPIEYLEQNPEQKFINLEPWYEGIRNDFYTKDQLYAYWTTMLAGAFAYCYGAHGIWNCGDGDFLSHWGKQTFDEALQLDTPRLIGASHQYFMESGVMDFPIVEVDVKKEKLISICRKNTEGSFLIFYPDFKGSSFNYSIENCFFPLTGLQKEYAAGGFLVIKGKLTD